MIRRRTTAAVGLLALAATALLTACGPNSGAGNAGSAGGKDDTAQVQQYQQAVDAAESAAAQAESDTAGDE